MDILKEKRIRCMDLLKLAGCIRQYEDELKQECRIIRENRMEDDLAKFREELLFPYCEKLIKSILEQI